MGKKKVEEMAQQREVFVNGAAKKNIDEKKANEIFDLIDKFSGYGFNKSHSVAYAYISYQTAWLKGSLIQRHLWQLFCLELWMILIESLLLLESQRKKELKSLLQISINQSMNLRITDNTTIIYGLGAIKGVGEALVNEIV